MSDPPAQLTLLVHVQYYSQDVVYWQFWVVNVKACFKKSR